VDLAGTGQAPTLRGDIQIENGVIFLPEPAQNLHAAGGDALLWKQVPQGTATHAPAGVAMSAEPYPAQSVSQPPATRAGETAAPALDLEIELSIPGGLWLRGQGLNVELSGDLMLRQRAGRPAVSGDLKAAGGTFRFLGRTFTVERGLVSFSGQERIDPELDLRLLCKLEEMRFWVEFGGTLQKPQLALTSDPEMPEGDIMSVLLFGRPLNELNSDQVQLVRQRATDLVTLYGTAQLEAQLAQQLGMDIVAIRRSQGQADRSSLVIGKYISRRALLKYEQVLGDLSAFFINLEY
jgi:translocation and assembly module TamB